MKTVNMYEAKTHLAQLVDEALAGKDVVVARNGTPLVRLVPIVKRKPSDGFGNARGQVVIADDFDAIPEAFSDYV